MVKVNVILDVNLVWKDPLQAGFDRLVNSDHISQVDPPCIYQPMIAQ